MLVLRKVAVTGGLSSGKSTVCRLFEEMGAYVVSSDLIVHQLLSPESHLGKQIIELLGNDVVKKGKFDRPQIAEKVFKDPLLLKQLEKILHPPVFAEMKKQYQKASKSESIPLFVAEVPLLFESHGAGWFDKTIAVVALYDVCLKRYIAKGGNAEDFLRRTQRQLAPEEKKARADYTIRNDGDFNALKAQVLTLFQELSR
jgi:dephospho-CoA kinase